VFFEPQTARPLKTAAYFRPSLAIYTREIEPVTIKGKGGKLEGYFYKARPSEFRTGKVALVLSGSGAPSEMHTPAIADKYQKNGVDILAVNYRGFGKSEGTPSEQGLYQDAEAMLNLAACGCKLVRAASEPYCLG